MPSVHVFMVLPLMSHSDSVPLIFLSPTYMSLGHFMVASPVRRATVSRTASAPASVMAYCREACSPRGCSLMLTSRLLPRSLSHVFVPWPRPAVW